MSPTTHPVSILLVDDDAEDRMLALDALYEWKLANEVHSCGDGEEALEFLQRQGRYAGRPEGHPGLILLDVNMPRMDGFELLAAIRSHPALRRIPVVMLTTSAAEADILRGYDLGVNSYITKPVSFDGMVSAMRAMGRYWFQLVELPPQAPPQARPHA